MTKRTFLQALMALFALRSARPATAAVPAETAVALTPEQEALLQEVTAWQAKVALPAVFLAPGTPSEPREPGGNRLGGAAWLPEGESWPLGRDGKPLGFLAQVDFATLPPLPDFPGEGVLQFFIGRDDLYGADFDTPEAGNFKTIYRTALTGAGRFEHGPGGEENIDDFSPLYGTAAKLGVSLTAAQPVAHRPWIESFLFAKAFRKQFGDRANDAVYERLSDSSSDGGWGGGIRVGGHPEFTQSDWRDNERYRDVDRVLLQLWTDDTVMMWGDSGQGQFLIRREDLLKRDFSRVFYQWDCY